jgi:hypothetical protein
MARVKEVHSNDMVAHLWAHQSQTSARNAQRNFYFDGNTIYSYGGHFPIAKIVENKRGGRAVVFTTRSYSVTTSKHISATRSAVREMTVFNVADITSAMYGRYDENLNDYAKRIAETIDKARHSRKYGESLYNHAAALAREANDYMKFFGVRRKPFADLATEEDRSRAIAHSKRAEELERKRNEAETKRREHLAARRAELESAFKQFAPQALELWRKGQPFQIFRFEGVKHKYTIRAIVSALGLRDQLRTDGATVFTSGGAEVPLSHVERAYRQLVPIRAAGEDWRRNGHTIHVGAFQIDSLEKNGTVRAGCHSFDWSDVETFAAAQGW